MNTARWNITISHEVDHALRLFLATQGGGKKGDLSRFVENAVKARILELTANQTKKANMHISENKLAAIVEEAIEWARRK